MPKISKTKLKAIAQELRTAICEGLPGKIDIMPGSVPLEAFVEETGRPGGCCCTVNVPLPRSGTDWEVDGNWVEKEFRIKIIVEPV